MMYHVLAKYSEQTVHILTRDLDNLILDSGDSIINVINGDDLDIKVKKI